jgi:glutamyl-Q tRNA(Asp) synthetase
MSAPFTRDTATAPPSYRGRFAPSPTGPLHFGSLVAAVASYLDARVHQGEWLLRIEDVDKPRTVPGAADQILQTLQDFGFEWDGPVLWQSQRDDVYRQAIAELQQRGFVFPCACTRREIAAAGLTAIDGAPRYPGTCRYGLPLAYQNEKREARSIRFRVGGQPVILEDRCQGTIVSCLETDVGDFVLLRADGLFAYQLAVVVDDVAQGITDVVRGADLLDSTPRQIAIQRALGVVTPRYLHVPIAVDDQGHKLSKQTGANPVDASRPVTALHKVLEFLGQAPPQQLATVALCDVWAWAIDHWNPQALPRQSARPLSLQPD